MRRRALLAAALLAPGCAWAQNATPFALPALPGSRLQPLGGLELDKAALGFGGLSGLHIGDDLEFTAIADVGRWLRGRLLLEGLRPVGLAALRSGLLHDEGGAPLPRGFAGDAEALARLPNGDWLVAFERWHRIRRYRDLDGPGRYVAAPPELAEAPGNGGLESLAILADGRWLLIAEGWSAPGVNPARRVWLGREGGPWTRLAYRAEAPMEPCDATPLPDGGALVLERSFSWLGGFRGRLVHLSARQLREAREGGVLQGEEWLRLDPPLPTDNYEAMALFRHQGRTLLALLSDDNQNLFQRSLLLLFALPEG